MAGTVIRRSGERPKVVGVTATAEIRAGLVWAELEQKFAEEICPVCKKQMLETKRTVFKNGRMAVTVRCPRLCYTVRKFKSAVPKEG